MKNDNVIQFRPRSRWNAQPALPLPGPDFDKLTAAIVLQRHRDGTLDERVVEALLLGVGLSR